MALPHAMSIYESRDLLVGFRRALRYAGKNGRIATLPEIVSARVQRVPGSNETWVMTSSSLYFGNSVAGNPIIIVAHGTGPLMNEVFRTRAYVHQHVVRNHDHFGTIPPSEFAALVRGDFGDVHILDASPYMSRSEHNPGALGSRFEITEESADDPLVKAIFGKDAGAYAFHHYRNPRVDRWSEKGPKRLGEIKFEYQFLPELNWANFLLLQVMDVGTTLCDRHDMSRFVAVRDKEPIRAIEKAPVLSDVSDRLKKIQSESDKLRHAVDMLLEMEAGEVL